MIDLHCHILPGVDDGSSSEEESCRMARLAVESGVTAVCATPHCNVPGCFDNYRTEALEERFLCLARLLGERDIPLRLYAGMEVYVTPETPRHLREGKLLTLGGSRYLLVEFGFEAPFSFAQIGRASDAGGDQRRRGGPCGGPPGTLPFCAGGPGVPSPVDRGGVGAPDQ